MRSLTISLLLTCLTTIFHLTLPAHSVYLDEAYETDWHIPLIGKSLQSSTFFHRPLPESPASLIYTVTDKNILAAIHPRDGALVWRQSLNNVEEGSISPFLAGPKKDAIARPGRGVVFSAAGKELRAWDSTDGKLIWNQEFQGSVEDLRVVKGEEGDDLVVLTVNGRVWRVSGATGDIISDSHIPFSGYEIHQRIHVTPSSVYVVGLEHYGASYQVRVHRSPPGPDEVNGKILDSATPDVMPFVGGPGIAIWKAGKSTLKVNILGTDSTTTIELPSDVDSYNILAHPDHTAFLVHIQTPSSSSAEVWNVDMSSLTVAKLFDIEPKPVTPTSFSASIAQNGQIYFTWVLPSGSVEIYGSSSPKPLSHIASNSTDIPAVELSTSEVIPRADNTFALRTFLTSYPVGNTHLVRNGAPQWSRPESLAGIKSAVWVELLDPTTEEVGSELHVEETQNVVSAYIHRVKRHVHELIVYGPAWVEKLPFRIMAELVPGYGGKQATEQKGLKGGKWRDGFGFRKFVVGVISNGGLVCIDVGRKGEVVWTIDNVAQRLAKVKGLFEVGKGLVGLVTDDGKYYEIDVFEGKVLKKVDLGEDKMVKTTALIEGQGERKSILAVLVPEESGMEEPEKMKLDERLFGREEIKILGGSEKLAQDTYIVVKDDDNRSVRGLKIDKETSTSHPAWKFTLPAQETITNLNTRPAHDPIASIGRVLGDRSVMYKYINPHLLAISTINPTLSTISVYLLDSISGSLLHSATHPSADTTKPVILTLAENWLVYTYFSDDELSSTTTPGAQGAAKSHHLTITELYESTLKNDRLSTPSPPSNLTQPLSSLPTLSNTPPKPHALSTTFLIPESISYLTTTTTKLGITTHEILALTTFSGNILSIPKRILDPRRPVGREPDNTEKEEGLFKYEPVIALDPRSFINHKRSLVVPPPPYIRQGPLSPLGTSNEVMIMTTPSALESTSLVLAITPTDLFGTRVLPSGGFDLLGRGFSKLQLVGTVVGLGVATRVVGPMVRRRGVNQRWAS